MISKKVFFSFFFFIIFLSSFLFAYHPNKKVEEFSFNTKYGFLSSGKILSNFKDARTALSAWFENYGEENEGHINIEFFENSQKAYTSFKNDESLRMIAVSSLYFFKNKKEIEKIANNFWSISFCETKFVQYYLLARKDLPFNTFNDLKNKTIAMYKFDEVGFIWLDKNSYLINKKTLKKVLKEIITCESEKKVLLNLFFNKTDLALVSKSTWNKLLKQNPNIKKKIKIVKKSKEIQVPLVGFFKKNESPLSLKAFFYLGAREKTSKTKEQINKMLKINDVFRLKKDDLKVLEKYYKEYFSLQKEDSK